MVFSALVESFSSLSENSSFLALKRSRGMFSTLSNPEIQLPLTPSQRAFSVSYRETDLGDLSARAVRRF